MTVTTRLKTVIRTENAQLETTICRRLGIRVDTYKAVRFAFRAAGIAIVGAAMFTPAVEAQPMTLLVLAAFVLGPDVVEAYLSTDR